MVVHLNLHRSIMHARFYLFTKAFRGSGAHGRPIRPASHPRISQFICRTCQSKFSTSAIRRAFGMSKKEAQNAAKNVDSAGKNKYPSRLVIYDAGDMRTSFVSFWKATAIFQFGIVGVFISPMLYRNENQPDPNIRLLQAVGIGLLGALPMVMMSYLTSPFVKRIALSIPPYAQLSRANLQRFASTLQPNTRIEFTTLRAFPFDRTSTVLLHELRTLAPQWHRFANIERVKSEATIKRWKAMSWYSKFVEIINEPRWKFYVKSGKSYTIKTGVPGVWEEVARNIQRQTARDAMKMGDKAPKAVAKLVADPKMTSVKRHTGRRPLQ